MKKVIIIAGVFLFCISNGYAQKKGAFAKLKEKATELGKELEDNTNGASKPNEKELKKDIESKTLDSKPVLKDSRNLSGIYYSKYPVRLGTASSNKFNYAQKFLVNYEEGDKNEIEFVTRYFYENRKDINPLVYAPKAGTPDYFPVTTSKKMGQLHIDGIGKTKYDAHATTTHAMQVNYLSFGKTDGNYITQSGWSFNNEDLLELEEGIIVTAQLEYTIRANTPEKYKYLQEHGTYNLFYKKEKEEKALAMSSAEVWDKIKAFYTKYWTALKEAEDGAVTMVKPIGKFKEEPSNTDLMKACKERMRNTNWKEELVYVYPVTSWENRFESVGLHGRTLTHRVFQVQAVLNDNGQCRLTQFLVQQDNTYKGGTAVEAFSGNPVKAVGDIGKTDVNCKKAMLYKK